MMKIKHLYIHVPFCKTICAYCDFCHKVYDPVLANTWLTTLEKEINEKCKDDYETIYIGGGTPTSLSKEQLEKLLILIKPYTNKVIEYTIEANPESLDIDKINLFKRFGINRVSLGLQSSNDRLLKLMNRKHSFSDVKDRINLLKDNGITNISIDIMYSLPTQTIFDLEKTIDDVLSLNVPHLSLYSLTIEDNTAFSIKGYKPLDEDKEADMYEYIVKRLSDNGYKQYEVSNFAYKGFTSKHNIGYWKYDDYLGISLSSTSKINNHRYTNTYNFDEYFNDFNSKSEDLYLSNNDVMFENLMMSLRMKNGLNIDEFNKKYNVNVLEVYKKGILNSNVAVEDGYIKVKNLGILNNTLLDFML